MVATGYNGTPSGTLDCLRGGCKRCGDTSVGVGQQLEACACVHAEANALLEAGPSSALRLRRSKGLLRQGLGGGAVWEGHLRERRLAVSLPQAESAA